jgi:hypothetical protein
MGIEPETYPRLAHLCKPKPIETEAELRCNLLMVDLLAGHELNEDQERYLEEISVNIEKYEDIHYPIVEEEDKKTPMVVRELLDDKIEIVFDSAYKVGDIIQLCKGDNDVKYKIIEEKGMVFICKKQDKERGKQ